MGVVNVKEQRTGDTAGGSVEAKTATRVFTVLMDSADDSSVRAELAAGIPREGNPHPHDNWRLAKQPQTSREGNSLLFTVTVPYETPPIPEGSDGTGNPLSQPAEIEWSFDLVEEVIQSDALGRPIDNSSDEPFDPPLTEQFSIMVLRVTKNEPTFDPNVAATFMNSTNDSIWYGFPRNTCWMNGITAPRIVQGSLVYFRVSYTVAIRADVTKDEHGADTWIGWGRRILDEGLRTKPGITIAGVPQYNPIKSGTPPKKITSPVKLDGFGGVLIEGNPPVWWIFETKKLQNWDKLRVF